MASLAAMFDQLTLQALLAPATLPFWLAFIGGFFFFHIRDRRQMLAAKMVVDGLYGVYFWLMHAYAGAYGIMIAVFGEIVQIVTPDRYMQRTMVWRNIIAAVLAVFGIFIAARQSADLLPLVAASAARFVETQRNPQHIRIGMAIILVLWTLYALERQLPLMVLAHVTVLVSVVLAIYRYRKTAYIGDEANR